MRVQDQFKRKTQNISHIWNEKNPYVINTSKQTNKKNKNRKQWKVENAPKALISKLPSKAALGAAKVASRGKCVAKDPT